MTPRQRSHGSRQKSRSAPPAREVELVIHSVGARGDGLARLDTDSVFVPFTAVGDRVLARIESRRGEGLAAALVEVLEPGPGRIEPPCPHFGRCGGCALQHLDDSLYTEWKESLLSLPLARAHLEVEPASLLRIAIGSRRRAACTFVRHRGGVLLGFNARASHAVVDIEKCPVLEPTLTAVLPSLRKLLAAAVPETGGSVVLTATEGGLDILVEAEARLDLPARERLAAFCDQADLGRFSWRQPDSPFMEPISRRRPVVVRFGGLAVEPPPGAFLQPTKAGEVAIAELVLAATRDAAVVADLFCGCGSFTLPLAVAGHVVHAVEGEEAPVRALEATVRATGLPITAEVRDLARRPLLAHELRRFQAVVFDPPRTGAEAQAAQLAEAGPKTVVAVSCNPATLARDLRLLVDGGYRLESVVPIDQFPWSPHLEAVAVLRR